MTGRGGCFVPPLWDSIFLLAGSLRIAYVFGCVSPNILIRCSMLLSIFKAVGPLMCFNILLATDVCLITCQKIRCQRIFLGCREIANPTSGHLGIDHQLLNELVKLHKPIAIIILFLILFISHCFLKII